ncbi:hypothetical protein M8C13_08985 [Crossiella sp. SN42]|uniref:hypothetical protein n=1 Tax=Crossiella sp. SN42 TaxID=2944808 RepID=UPI00207CC056|nr:hypothetical protein [Crossiella sp. SN42]MCO1575891.1 hypothetical protein [Crossiella sp. SN42]
MIGLRLLWNDYHLSPQDGPRLHDNGKPYFGDRAAFFLGRGRGSRLLGKRRARSTPGQLLRLPVGHDLLSATTEHDYLRHVETLLSWNDSDTDDHDAVPQQLRCPAGGVKASKWMNYEPYEVGVNIYAFDNGAVHLWNREDHEHYTGQWFSLDLPAPGSPDPVWLIPEARDYGNRVPETAHLELPEIAHQILTDFHRRRTEDPVLSLCQDLWIDVRLRGHTTVYVFGLPEDELNPPWPCPIEHIPNSCLLRAEPLYNEFQDDITDAIIRLTRPYDWHNPFQDDDTRLGLTVHLLNATGNTRLANYRGTVTIVDEHHRRAVPPPAKQQPPNHNRSTPAHPAR